jgi:hypothetical protein
MRWKFLPPPPPPDFHKSYQVLKNLRRISKNPARILKTPGLELETPGIRPESPKETIMTAKNALAVIGKKLEKEYKRLGFSYSKKYKLLKKRTKKYDYYVFFSSFLKYTPDAFMELHVDLLIIDRIVLKTNINANSELFHINLWDMGNHYNIANKTLAHMVCMDLKTKIETCLMPQMQKLEEQSRIEQDNNGAWH